MTGRLTMPLALFLEESRCQSEDREYLVFKCPACGALQNAHDFYRAGAGEAFHDLEGRLGVQCVGRWRGKTIADAQAKTGEGCDWSLDGNPATAPLVIIDPDGNEHPHFDLASWGEADGHRAKQRESLA